MARPGHETGGETRETKEGRPEKLGTGWKVLGLAEAVGLAVLRENLGMGRTRGEKAGERSTGEWLGDVVHTSVDHVQRAGQLFDTAQDLDDAEYIRTLQRQITDAETDAERAELNERMANFERQSTRDREDRIAQQEGLAKIWEALTGSAQGRERTA